MSFETTYTTFASDVQADIAKKGLAITDRLDNGDSFDEILKQMYELRSLIQELSNYNFTGYDILEYPGMNVKRSHILQCFTSEYHLEADMHRIYNEYKIRPFPGVLYPLSPINFLSCDHCLIPGGGPGYFLTKNSEGNLIWQRIGGYQFRQEFVYSSGPQEFSLMFNGSRVDLVFINGQLIPQGYYSYDPNTFILTLLDPPIVLSSGARVVVYAGISDLQTIQLQLTGDGFTAVRNSVGAVMFDSLTNPFISFEGLGGIDVTFDPASNKVIISINEIVYGLYRAEFIWTTGGFVFTLPNAAEKLHMVFINGQLLSSVDYNHTPNSNSVTLLQQLLPLFEITVLYKRTVS